MSEETTRTDAELFCTKHKRSLECLAGCSAHRSNWYCPECELERENAELRAMNCDLRREVERWVASVFARENADLKHHLAQAREAVQELAKGKPLGPVAGAHTIINQQREIEKLRARLERQQAVMDAAHKVVQRWMFHGLGRGDEKILNDLCNAVQDADAALSPTEERRDGQ